MAEAARGARLDEAGRAAAVRGRMDVSSLAIRDHAFPSLQELEFKNVNLEDFSFSAFRGGTPHVVAGALADMMSTHTAPQLRTVILDNVSMSNEALAALLADGGAVLRAVYARGVAGEENRVRVVGALVGHGPPRPPPPPPPPPPAPPTPRRLEEREEVPPDCGVQ
jgi:hypothetical protein